MYVSDKPYFFYNMASDGGRFDNEICCLIPKNHIVSLVQVIGSFTLSHQKSSI